MLLCSVKVVTSLPIIREGSQQNSWNKNPPIQRVFFRKVQKKSFLANGVFQSWNPIRNKNNEMVQFKWENQAPRWLGTQNGTMFCLPCFLSVHFWDKKIEAYPCHTRMQKIHTVCIDQKFEWWSQWTHFEARFPKRRLWFYFLETSIIPTLSNVSFDPSTLPQRITTFPFGRNFMTHGYHD